MLGEGFGPEPFPLFFSMRSRKWRVQLPFFSFFHGIIRVRPSIPPLFFSLAGRSAFSSHYLPFLSFFLARARKRKCSLSLSQKKVKKGEALSLPFFLFLSCLIEKIEKDFNPPLFFFPPEGKEKGTPFPSFDEWRGRKQVASLPPPSQGTEDKLSYLLSPFSLLLRVFATRRTSRIVPSFSSSDCNFCHLSTSS